MASEIRVNKIINRSGLSTVTFSDTGAIVSGIVTANNFSGNVTGNVTGAVTGSGANLTSIPAGQLTGTVADARLTTVSSSKLSGALPALDGSALTGINTAFGSGTSVNTSGIITATAFVPTAQGSLSHRNLIQNGSFIVHQRGGTSTAQGFLLDRWYAGHNNSTVTISQGTETSGTVYEKGLVNYYRVTNTANSTASNTYRYLRHSIEAQNLLKSGWNYKSASAKITLSFYVRSSVAQNFYGYLRLSNSPDSKYVFETGSLTANTWTKVTKVISGYTSANINNDNSTGMQVLIAPFWGTDFTASGVALNTWAAWNGGERAPDYTTTWAGTNGATFDVTGVQLEVGPVSTPFEHRSYAQELTLAQRYYQQYVNPCCTGVIPNNGSKAYSIGLQFQKRMRAVPTLSITNAGTGGNISDGNATQTIASLNAADRNVDGASMYLNLNGDLGDYRPACTGLNDSTTNTTTYKFTAEI